MSSDGMNPKDRVGAKKAPLGLVPPALQIGAAEAMATGAEKYGPYNWREFPVEVMTYVEAAERHLAAFRDGEDCAPDTGVHHIKHVVAGMGILLDSLALGIAVDNRPLPGPAARLLAALDKSQPKRADPLAHTDDHPNRVEGCPACDWIMAYISTQRRGPIFAGHSDPLADTELHGNAAEERHEDLLWRCPKYDPAVERDPEDLRETD